MYFIINFMDTLSVLGRVSVDVTKHHDQKYKVTENRVVHIEEAQDRNSNRGEPELGVEEAMEECCMAGSTWLAQPGFL